MALELILSWNVDGYTPSIHKEVKKLLGQYRPQILFLNETKISQTAFQEYAKDLPDYNCILSPHNPWRYHGVAALVLKGVDFRVLPVDLKCPPRRESKGSAGEGRVLALETATYITVGTYVPNSGNSELKNLNYRINEWDPALYFFLESCADSGKPVIWIGDINVALQEIDVHDPSRVRGRGGFADEERASFARFLSKGWVDVYRSKYPTKREFTWVGYPQASGFSTENIHTRYGLRLDNVIVSSDLVHRVEDSFILSDVSGSDHLPVGITLS